MSEDYFADPAGYLRAFRDELAPKTVDLADPCSLFRSSGMQPDPAQVEILTTAAPRVAILWARQAGKTASVSCRSAHLAQSRREATVVICAGRVDQSKHLLRACRRFSGRGATATGTATELTIRYPATDSRILVVPASDTARGLTADLVVVEEASVVPDEIFHSVLLLMVSVTHGQVIILGTPGSEAGFFFDIWSAAPRWDPAKPTEHGWLKSLRTWEDCPRIDPWTVDELRRSQPRAYRREYCCEWAGADDAIFAPEIVREMVDETVAPLDLLDTL
jgi:hypothetical protein